MSKPPFKVRAVYDYSSPHDDDLNFSAGQIITVTDEEDSEWYVGEYKPDDGATKNGLFPRNFVERFEPQAPPRPQRSRPKPEPQPEPDSIPESVPTVSQHHEPEHAPYNAPPKPEAQPEETVIRATPPALVKEEPPPTPKPQPVKPALVTASKQQPPQTTAKPASSSFKDRIAAFNKPAAPPIAPKPSGASAGQPFIKKPFVAPPPARNAYVPPAPRQDAPTKTYRREEDPEISERVAQDQRDAEDAGVAAAKESQDAEEAPKATSLKDRIALLQKQQQEQAARRAEATSKPQRPVQPRTESDDRAGDVESISRRDIRSPERAPRESADLPRPIPGRLPSHDAESEEVARDAISDGNEADQSGAGETTEDAAGDSTEVDEAKETRHPRATGPPPRSSMSASRQPALENVEQEGKEHENEEGETEEEIDPEARRREELRARMAKMSGGMGMAGMFGMPPPKPPAPARKASDQRSPSTEARSPPPMQRVPMIPIPGAPSHTVKPPLAEGQTPYVEKEPEEAPVISEESPAGTVPDVEDLGPRPHRTMSTIETHTPLTPQDRPMPPTPTSKQAAPAPPVPATRPVAEPQVRTVPPPPPRVPQPDDSDEDSAAEPEQGFSRRDSNLNYVSNISPVQPSVPSFQAELPQRHSSVASSIADKRSSQSLSRPPPIPSSPPPSSEKRGSRIPSVPSGVPQIPPMLAQERPPPPPPPSAVPPTRQSIGRESFAGPPPAPEERDSEYEGDYDTDIAPTAPRKDALRAHVGREPSLDDDSTLSEGTSGRSPNNAPPPVPQTQRAPPPPPPHQVPPSRKSVEVPRAPPPIPPPHRDDPNDDYDPYRYDGRPAPPSRKETGGTDASSSTKGSASQETVQRSTPPVAPTGLPPHVHSVPPPLPPEHRDPPPGPTDERISMGDEPRHPPNLLRRSMTGRRSMDPGSRPQADDSGHIAKDVDLSRSTLWWAQPNMVPPGLQNRSDVAIESEESTTSKRGGRSMTNRDVYILFQDYSQTIITASYDAKDPSRDVHLEQRHEPPPPKMRQDQLEAAYSHYGERIAAAAVTKQSQTVGDGSSMALITELLKGAGPNVLQPVGSRAYGALVYQNMQNSSVSQFDEIRPGDVVSFRNAKFKGKHGAMHAKYSMDVGKPDHVAIVMEWDGTKKKIRALEQGREKEGKKVKLESFRVGDLGGGEVKVWRVVGRDYVGWESNA